MVREPNKEKEKGQAERLRKNGDTLFLCPLSSFILPFHSLFLTIILMDITYSLTYSMEQSPS